MLNLALGLLATACQTVAYIEQPIQAAVDSPQAMALEQARRIVDLDLPEGFIPPPRTVDDVLALLAQAPDAQPAEWARDVAAARIEPSPDLRGEPLSRFYFRRAGAAYRIGDPVQQLADLRQAFSLLSASLVNRRGVDARSPGNELSVYAADVTISLAWAETVVGNRDQAVGLLERAIADECCNIYLFVTMVYILHEFGDVSGIQRYAQQAREAIRQLERVQAASSEERWGLGFIEYWVSERTGRAEDAEKHIRSTIRIFEAAPPRPDRPGWLRAPFLTARLHRLLGQTLDSQDRSVEAEIEIRFALEQALWHLGKANNETVAAILALGRLVEQQGRPEEAEALTRAALDILTNSHYPYRRVVVQARRDLGSALIQQRKWRQAMHEYDAVAGDWSKTLGSVVSMLRGSTSVAWALLETGRAEEARQYATAAVEWRRNTLGRDHRATAWALGVLAAAQVRLGERQAALANFDEANRILLARNWKDVGEPPTAPDQGLATEIQLSLLADLAAGAPPEQRDALASRAFRVADAVQVRSAQRALAAASARLALQDSDLTELARREQDAGMQIQIRIRSLGRLVAAPPGQRDEDLLAALRAQLDELTSARALLRTEIDRRFPTYGQLIGPRSATLDQAQAVLSEGEALVSFYIGERQSFVFALSKHGPVTFVALDLGSQEIERLVDAVRHAVDHEITSLDEIPRFDVGAAHSLYVALLEPVHAVWHGAQTLLVVPHGPLARLPIGVLVTAPTTLPPGQPHAVPFDGYVTVPWLIRQVAIAHLPSVSSLVTARSLPVREKARRPFIGFGDPWFSEAQAMDQPLAASTPTALRSRSGDRPAPWPLRRRGTPRTDALPSARLAVLPPLPETADEILDVARALGADDSADVYLGRRASEPVVRRVDLSDRRIVMFATHGLSAGSLDGLAQPALALTAPQIAGGGGDGLLTVDEILRLKLSADWVVLSACDTRRSRVSADADTVSALAGAFFYAGARALLVSNWPVETLSAKLLTVELFRRQAGTSTVSRAEALRQAMLDLIDAPGSTAPDTGKPLYRYAHPIFWGPFSLVGDPTP